MHWGEIGKGKNGTKLASRAPKRPQRPESGHISRISFLKLFREDIRHQPKIVRFSQAMGKLRPNVSRPATDGEPPQKCRGSRGRAIPDAALCLQPLKTGGSGRGLFPSLSAKASSMARIAHCPASPVAGGSGQNHGRCQVLVCLTGSPQTARGYWPGSCQPGCRPPMDQTGRPAPAGRYQALLPQGPTGVWGCQSCR